MSIYYCRWRSGWDIALIHRGYPELILTRPNESQWIVPGTLADD